MLHRKKINKKDVLYILKHLRQEDKHEAIIQKGENYVRECLKDIMSFKDSSIMGYDRKTKKPVCIGGIVKNKEQSTGVVWLLSTPEIVNHQITLLRNIKTELKKANNDCWILYNMIYKENELAKKWLSKFGFTFEKIIGMEDFEYFYRKRETRGLI